MQLFFSFQLFDGVRFCVSLSLSISHSVNVWVFACVCLYVFGICTSFAVNTIGINWYFVCFHILCIDELLIMMIVWAKKRGEREARRKSGIYIEWNDKLLEQLLLFRR